MPNILNKILLVDDDRFLLTLICRTLFKRGFICLKADSVKAAFEILKNETPDIILSDYSMPETDGFEFRKLLLENKRWKDIPFVFFTSFTDNQLMKEGLDLKAVDYIDKTTPIPLVVSKLTNILDTIRRQHEQSIYEIGAAARALNLLSVPESAPENEQYKLDFLYQTFENYPGGDFIDFIVADDDYTFIILGDVMGKKWGAWFFSFNFLSYIRSAIRICVFERDLSTANIVNKINRVVIMDPVLKDILSTLSILMINQKTGKIHYTGAGDLPLLLFRKESRLITHVKAPGLLLGIMEDGMFDEQIIEMETGDQLLIFTDGMIDFKEKDGSKTSYPKFENQVGPLLGKQDTFELMKKELFSNDTDMIADDRSLLFIEKK